MNKTNLLSVQQDKVNNAQDVARICTGFEERYTPPLSGKSRKEHSDKEREEELKMRLDPIT